MKDPFYEKWWFILFLVVVFLVILTIITQNRDTNIITEFNRSMENRLEQKEDKKKKSENTKKTKKENNENKSSDLDLEENGEDVQDDQVGVKSEIIKDPRVYELRDKIESIVVEYTQVKILDISVLHNRILDSGDTYISIVELELLDDIDSKSFISEFAMDFIVKLSDEEDLVDIKLIWNYNDDILDIIEMDRVDGILGIK